MMDFEKVQVASLEAADEAEKQNSILRQLERELERDTTSLSCADYMSLQARTAQQRERARLATEKAQKLEREVDTLRSREAARMQRETAQRDYDSKMAALNATRAEIESKQRAIRDLQGELPIIQQRQNVLLFELDRAKTALQQSEVSA
ncbi:MAG: hypothetical protein ABSD76_00525 [Terriglobales bacterium]|jgi:hypothetical protein